MKRSVISIIANITFILGLALGIYLIVDLYLIKRALPEGVCPFISNKPLIYTAIGLLLTSFIVSLFEKKSKKGDVEK